MFEHLDGDDPVKTAPGFKGIDISGKKPKKLTLDMIERSEKIVTMGCGSDVCPAPFLPRLEDWELEDPSEQPLEKVREIRDEIQGRVVNLIKELSSSS